MPLFTANIDPFPFARGACAKGVPCKKSFRVIATWWEFTANDSAAAAAAAAAADVKIHK